MGVIRKQVYLESHQDAKLKRLARSSGRSESELIREAVDGLPEKSDPILEALRAAGLLAEPRPATTGRATAREAHERDQAWAREHGPIGLSGAVLEDRAEQP